jgi:hypothetical protein
MNRVSSLPLKIDQKQNRRCRPNCRRSLSLVTCVFTEKLGDEGAVQCGWGYGGDEPQITIKK